MPRIQLHTSAAHTAEGELIAKRLQARAQANELLLERSPAGPAWRLATQAVAGGVAGWLATQAGGAPLQVIGAAACAALLLAVGLTIQLAGLRRRQQAIIALLLEQPPAR